MQLWSHHQLMGIYFIIIGVPSGIVSDKIFQSYCIYFFIKANILIAQIGVRKP